MDPERFLVGVLLVPGGLVILAMALRDVWKVPSLPPSRLGDLSEGPVMAVGKVAGAGLRDPILGEPCAFYEVRVLEMGTGKYKVLRTLHVERSSAPFAIADETGRAEVEPDGAALELTLEVDEVQRNPLAPMIENGFSPGVNAYLERIGRPPAEGMLAPFKLGPGNYLVKAVILRPGEQVCAFARAERSTGGWRLRKPERRPLFLCVSPEAAAHVRRRGWAFGATGLAMAVFGAALALRSR